MGSCPLDGGNAIISPKPLLKQRESLLDFLNTLFLFVLISLNTFSKSFLSQIFIFNVCSSVDFIVINTICVFCLGADVLSAVRENPFVHRNPNREE